MYEKLLFSLMFIKAKTCLLCKSNREESHTDEIFLLRIFLLVAKFLIALFLWLLSNFYQCISVEVSVGSGLIQVSYSRGSGRYFICKKLCAYHKRAV